MPKGFSVGPTDRPQETLYTLYDYVVKNNSITKKTEVKQDLSQIFERLCGYLQETEFSAKNFLVAPSRCNPY